MQSAYIYLKGLNQDLPKPFYISLLFKGLPDAFDAFASRKLEEINKDLDKVEINALISDIILEEARINSNNPTLLNKVLNNTVCSYCKKIGHIESSCFNKYPELKKDNKSKKGKDKNKKKDTYKKKNNKKDKKEDKSESTQVMISTTTDPINPVQI